MTQLLETEGVGDEVASDSARAGCSLPVWMMEAELFPRFPGVVVTAEGLKMELVGENSKRSTFHTSWLEDDCTANIVFDGVIEPATGWGDEVTMTFCITDWG